MKKLFMIIMLGITIVLSGCSLINGSIVTNEITNKVINVEEINIQDFEDLVVNVIEMVSPAVIGVTNYGALAINSSNPVGVGSGVIYKRVANLIDDELGEVNGNINTYTYYVITNKHVIEDSKSPTTKQKLKVYLGDEDIYVNAIELGKDSKVDLAVLKFNHTTLIQPVVMGDSNNLRKGSFAVAIGNPDGYNFYGSATFGIVSHPKRYMSDDTDNDGINDFDAEYIQHDVAINPGNSGGGLFNMRGELIGINTLKLVSTDIDNMGFAIPVNVVEKLIYDYLEQGIVPIRPRLGVTVVVIRGLTDAIIAQYNLLSIPEYIDYGLYVINIAENSTIGDSPIQVNDIILKFDGKNLSTTSDVTVELNKLTTYMVGSVVEITYYSRSDNEIKTVNVTLKP
jgi:serine protease Do